LNVGEGECEGEVAVLLLLVSDARLPLRRRTRDVLRGLAFFWLPPPPPPEGDPSGGVRDSTRSARVQVLPLADRVRLTSWRKKCSDSSPEGDDDNEAPTNDDEEDERGEEGVGEGGGEAKGDGEAEEEADEEGDAAAVTESVGATPTLLPPLLLIFCGLKTNLLRPKYKV
jgi:hypothetical protein